ncbi:MAG TPA: adenosine kinase, partial [Bacillota bacterium]|nr:adenosine kinase [Bacillota bacterium]
YQRALTEYLNDNIQHIEIRSGLGNLYDLEGHTYNAESVLDITRRILRNTPGITLNYIYSTARRQPETTVFARMETAIRLRAAYPELIAGFDLVGEEDQGYPLIHFLPDFLRVGELEEKYGIDLPFYFHSGESDWADLSNLYDAVLLGSKRIGHGYNLFYYPILEPILKAIPIPLELCPISNQVLNYVADLRDHPAGGYVNSGVPLTLSSDDPAVYGNTGATYDFWEALMAWDLDLRSMKQFAYNSIVFSSLEPARKTALLNSWTAKWEQFIANFLRVDLPTE